MKALKSLLVTLMLGGLMWLGWLKFHSDLSKGSTSTTVQKLKQMEEQGPPTVAGTLLSGEAFTFESLRGQVFVVNFWASWCNPCAAEFPSMLELIKHYKGKVKMVAISADKELGLAKEFLKTFKGERADVVNIWDPEMKLGQGFGTAQLPESYVFDHNFKLVKKVIGSDSWYSPEVLQYFDQLLNKKN